MDHQLGSALARRTLRQLRHLHSKNLERGRHHARFDAADETLMPIEHTQRAVEVDAALGDNIRHRGQTGLRYVQERNNFRMTMRHDVSRKTFEGRGSRTARIDDRCHARVYATHVRMNAPATSTTRLVSSRAIAGAICAILPCWIAISLLPWIADDASITVPPLRTRSYMATLQSLFEITHWFRPDAQPPYITPVRQNW